jgi:hypothetical protein
VIEIELERFHNSEYEEQGYCLYLLKNGNGDVLYLGITQGNVWDRWFGFGGHIVWDGEVIYGTSPIGEKIENHLPESLKWKIQLWTLEDCGRFCKDELPSSGNSMTVAFFEPIMIQKLSPILNSTYNLHPGKDTTPKSKIETEKEKKLDEAYKKLFEK